MEFRVLKTLRLNDKLLVIYDWMEFPEPYAIRNLYAYDLEGERLWIAEQRRPGDFFTGFVGDRKLLQLNTW